MKRGIKALLDEGVDRRAIAFCPRDALSKQDLRRTVKIGGDLAPGFEGDRYWFFDGITYVADRAVVLIARLPSLRDKRTTPPDSTKMNEQQIGMTLLHALLSEDSNAILDETALMVQRNPASGSEIDFAGPLLPVPIESKYVSKGWKRESKALRDAYREGVVLTRDVLDTSGAPWAVPSGVFSWAIGS